MTAGLFLSGMICIAALVVAALIGLVVILLRPTRGKSKDASTDAQALPAGRPSKSPAGGWKSWLLYVVIALLLGIWTLWATVFFLLVVWILRQNPGPETDFKVGANEKNTARRVYTWLFLSPLLTVPIFILILVGVYGDSTDRLVLAALTPLILHIPLLAGLTSKNRFVYRHTQQGILLMALRAGLASLAASLLDSGGIFLYLFGNGALWLVGSILGWDQVNQGKCWVMEYKRETIELITSSLGKLSPQVHLEKSREFMQQFKKEQAMAHALAAFRQGNRDMRLQALWVLEVLEEVEKF